MQASCQDCTTLPTPTRWQYYPGSPTSFASPTKALPFCAGGALNAYQVSIAGCVQTPIACNSTVNLDAVNPPFNRDVRTGEAVSCLTHSENNKGDTLDTSGGTNPPFEFIAGDDNPLGLPTGTKLLVSDSIVTVPVYNSTAGTAPPTTDVPIIGFVQLFLNPDGLDTAPNGHFKTRVVNLVGCGTNATTQPVQGNGGSAVAVRLLSP
jgi:hypothetical protein